MAKIKWEILEFFLNEAEHSLDSVNLITAQFKDTVSYMCLACALVASWPLMQEWLDGRFEPF